MIYALASSFEQTVHTHDSTLTGRKKQLILQRLKRNSEHNIRMIVIQSISFTATYTFQFHPHKKIRMPKYKKTREIHSHFTRPVCNLHLFIDQCERNRKQKLLHQSLARNYNMSHSSWSWLWFIFIIVAPSKTHYFHCGWLYHASEPEDNDKHQNDLVLVYIAPHAQA